MLNLLTDTVVAASLTESINYSDAPIQEFDFVYMLPMVLQFVLL